ncbi:MAG: hypothetical protein JSW07_06985 [bacterium]|nr:MAG: hypothetical protein JSW07_06985 [bacterium]
MIRPKNYYLLILFYILLATPVFSQQVIDLYEKITTSFNQNSYYTTLNLCREVIKICETTPEPECWYTNIMKDIYRCKGITEFEIYKKEPKKKRLSDAIESLTLSYSLFRDAEVQFLRGYLQSLNAILIKNKTDLSGLVIAWESLLSLYARNGWRISTDITAKLRLYIRVAEKFSEPIPGKNYTGVFAKFIIVMACDLAEKGDIPESEKKYFKQIRLKYCREDGIQWQKWRSSAIPPK